MFFSCGNSAIEKINSNLSKDANNGEKWMKPMSNCPPDLDQC